MKLGHLSIPLILSVIAFTACNKPLDNCCSTTVNITGTVTDTIQFPNVITPNYDGFNDYFRIFSNNSNTYSIRIRDKKGRIVYATQNYKNDFSGISGAGKTLNFGIYKVKIARGSWSIETYLTIIRNVGDCSALPTCQPVDPGDPLLN